MNFFIREMTKTEYPILQDFLYEAIYIPDGVKSPDKTIIKTPELQVYIKDFGSQVHDKALVAEVNGKIVGCVWVRIMNDYGHIDDKTPSFAISVLNEYRKQSIGTALMSKMLLLLKSLGYKNASLAVQKENYAVKMYLNLGFKIVQEKE